MEDAEPVASSSNAVGVTKQDLEPAASSPNTGNDIGQNLEPVATSSDPSVTKFRERADC